MSDIIAGMTKAGLELLAKSQLGKTITFTKIKIGDGTITNEDVSELEDLINVIDTLTIKSSEIIEGENDSISLKVTSLIQQAEDDYYFREIGLFALDPDSEEEILYGYVNKGDEATFIPENTSSIAIQELASMVVAIGNTDNVVVNCESDLKITEQIEGNGGYSLFDAVIKDHILTYEESEGFGLQGTYVYKEAIANERWGYKDFYEKCLEERDEATTTTTVLGGTSVVTYNHANGHIYFDIANKSAIDAFYNTYGVAWFYGIDEENERIFLPRNNYFFKMSSSNVGGYNAPQLPPLSHSHSGSAVSAGSHSHTRGTMNITGYIGRVDGGSGASGAFYSNGTEGKLENQDGKPDPKVYFDAKRSWTGSTSSDGSHSHTISISSANATSGSMVGTTVLPPSSNQLLYIVVGNVRQKSAYVINGELQDAISSINTKKTSVLSDITSAKNSAVGDITSAKNSAVGDIESASTTELGKINNANETAQGYAQSAQLSAQQAGQYAKIAVRGQVNSDFEEDDPTKPAFIKNKPNCDYENIVYKATEQILTNKTIDGENNTLSNIPFSAIAQGAKNTNITNINNVSDNDFPTSLAVYNAVNNISSLNNIVGDGEIIDVENSRETNVSVVSSNENLTVTCSYSGTQSSVGTIEYNFTYGEYDVSGSNPYGWLDENNNVVDLTEYDISVTGTPEIDDVITLQYITTGSSQITGNVANVAKTGSYNDLTEQPIFATGLSQSTVLETNVSVVSSNENLTVTCSYSGTQSQVGEIVYYFTYTSNGWVDDEDTAVSLNTYDISVTGTPVVDDVITLTYKTVNRVKVVSNVSVPTKTSQLTNDSGFLTQHQTLPTKLSQFADDLGTNPTHTHSQYLTNHQDISGKEDINKAMTTLSSSGTIALTDNSVNKITPSGAVTFTLPSISDLTKYHQILVQVNLSSVVSISVGTTRYFNKTAPDLSEAGVYNLIYEYDNANGYWVCGAISKGVAS